MRTGRGTDRTAPARGGAPPAGEGGFLLVMVMVVMLVVSTLVASTLVNSFLERSLAKNQNYASVALQAAEAGLARGLTWVRENQGSLPNPYTANPTWTQSISGRFDRDLNADGDIEDQGERGGGFTVTLRFKREWRDVNGDGDCTDPGEDSGYKDNDGTPASACPGDIVLYNKCLAANNCFGEWFPNALYSGAVGDEGYPVIEIDSTGFYGNDPATGSSFRQIALDVARNKIDIQVEGAVTARGNITVKGSGYVDGNNWNEAGTSRSATCSDLPAVSVEAPATVTTENGCAAVAAGGNPQGSFSEAGCEKEDIPTGTLETTPWGILGLPKSTFDEVFTETSTATALTGTSASPTYVWMTEDLHVMGGSGYGILVVHNENFNPVNWAAQCPTGVTGAGYCVTDNAPATFFMNGNVTYTGVIIADQVMRVNGTAATTGAVISIGGVNVDGDVTGNWTAKYSCEAIENALGGFGYGTKIAWHRLR